MMIEREITQEQKKFLEKVAEEIDICKISTTYGSDRNHSVKTGTRDQRGARQDVVGLLSNGNSSWHSACHQKHPQLMRMCRKFMKMHHPDMQFKTAYINVNTICQPHLDRKNSGESLIVGFGDYKGGQTNIFVMQKDGSFKKQQYDISKYSLSFDGSKVIHSSSEFVGKRYSLVFFN